MGAAVTAAVVFVLSLGFLYCGAGVWICLRHPSGEAMQVALTYLLIGGLCFSGAFATAML